MKKINLKGLSEVLSEKELKTVMGGSGWYTCGGKNGSCSGTCPPEHTCQWVSGFQTCFC